MATYEDWNRAIYNYYFNENTVSDNMLFCVDHEAIEEIGKELNVEGDIIKSFMKRVLDKITVPNKNGRMTINCDIFDIYTSNGVPSQTAIIAFFILIAETLGEDGNFSTESYWKKVDSVAKGFYSNINIDSLRHRAYIPFFDAFQEHITKTFDIKFEFYNGKNFDIVRRPIFHTVISFGDRNLLYYNFGKLQEKYGKVNINNDFDKIIDDRDTPRKFRKILKSIAKNDKLLPELKQRIHSIYDSWDGHIIEYNVITKSRTVNEISLSYALSYNYQTEWFDFYETIRSKENFGDIEFNNKKFSRSELKSAYNMIKIEDVDLSLSHHNYADNNNPSRKIVRRPSDFITLKENENGLYIEDIVRVGDVFYCIGTMQAFRDYRKTGILKYCTGMVLEDDDFIQINEDLYITAFPLKGERYISSDMIEKFGMDNLKPLVYDSRKNKLFFEKGLKIGEGKHSYIYGAPPVLYFPGSRNIRIEDKFVENSDKRFYLSESENAEYSQIGEYRVYVDDNSEPFDRYEILMPDKIVLAEGYEYFYKVIDDTKEVAPRICGALLENVPDYCKTLDGKAYQKIYYILKILEKHTNAKSYPIDGIFAEQIGIFYDNNNFIMRELREYIESNEYIDDYIECYLNEIGKMLV